MRPPQDQPTILALSTSPWHTVPHFIQGAAPEPYSLAIGDAARLTHLYALGKTGTGKTTLLETLMRQDLERGHGFAFLDPHGDLAERMLSRVPLWRRRHVVYFNPADLDHPPPLNVLAGVTPENRHLVASSVVSTFKRFWADSWGPRTEQLLRNSTYALLHTPGATLLDVARLLADDRFRTRTVARLTDPALVAFWGQEYPAYSANFRQEIIAPLQNKLGAFLVTPPLRHVVGQRTNLFELRELLDSGHVLIANLSKGRLGEDTSALLGSLLLTRFMLAALSRADQPEEERRPFYLYVDELHSFATPSTLTTLLTEARKYKVGLALASQHLTQDDDLRRALFGAGTFATFGVNAEDAELIAQHLAPYTSHELAALDPHHFVLKLPESAPLPAVTLSPVPLPPTAPHVAAHVRRHTRRHFTRPRALIERSTAKGFAA